MEILGFSIDDGYPEAIVRGLRKGFLKDETYTALKNCTNLSDFKLVLEDTDYSYYIATEASPIEISVLKNKLRVKLAKEIEHLIAQSAPPLTDFLKMMLHGFMIDNVIYIIEGVKNNVDLEVLLKRADPLGYFPELKNIRTVDGDNYSDLYETVLIDIPIGIYFRKFLEDVMYEESARNADRIAEIMRDYKPEKIKNLLKKIWISEFYHYCDENMNGVTAEIMKDLLSFESDC